jgi:hypothetical protein
LLRSSTRITSKEGASREELRHSYLPAGVRVLFIGESPPAAGTFFYAEDSELYRATRDAFYEVFPGLHFAASFLRGFAALGCYLEDLCHDPVNHLNAQERRSARRGCEDGLATTLSALQVRAIVVLLRSIIPNVARAATAAHCDAEQHVVTYPSRWHRHRLAYRRELTAILRDLVRRGVLRP